MATIYNHPDGYKITLRNGLLVPQAFGAFVFAGGVGHTGLGSGQLVHEKRTRK